MSLTLSAASGTSGGSIPVDLGIDPGNTSPAAIQWTIRYPADAIASIDVIPGPVGDDAAKLLVCNPTPGVITCIAYGLNGTVIGGGVLATLSVIVAVDASGTIAIDLSDPVSVDAAGGAVASGANGAVIEVKAE